MLQEGVGVAFVPHKERLKVNHLQGAGASGLHKSKPPFPHLHPGPVHHNNRWEGALVELDPRHNPLGLEEVPRFPETQPGVLLS